MKDDALEILRKRFALGEIDESQFKSMSALLNNKVDTTPKCKTPLMEIQHLRLYEDHYCDTNPIIKPELREKYLHIPYSEVISINGNSRHETLYGVNSINWSSYYIKSSNGRISSIKSEETGIIGQGIHKKIRQAFSIIASKTFQNRLLRAKQTLIEKGELPLRSRSTARLHATGHLTIREKKFDIAECYKNGVFGIGTERSSLSGLSYATSPNELVVCERKALFGGIPRNAVRYDLDDDFDVIRTLIESYAKGHAPI